MFQVPGAIRPSSRRWSLPIAVTALIAQSGTESADGEADPAALLQVIHRNAVPLTVKVHTRRVRDQVEDAVGDRLGLDVLDVVELATFGNH